MKKLWLTVRKWWRSRQQWRWPRQSDVLVYDGADIQDVLRYLEPWKPEVLHLRGEQINIPVLLACLIAKGRMSTAYVRSFIERVRPRLIVTTIDNGRDFLSLSIRHPNVKTMFIQNGLRGYYADIFEHLDRLQPPRGCLKVDYMMTFGTRIAAEYGKYVEGTFFPIGSVRNNVVARHQSPTAGTIIFISQYRNMDGFFMGQKFYTHQDFFEQADRIVLPFLVRYADERGKKLSIVPCGAHLKDDTPQKEREYHNRLAGRTCVFSEWRWYGSSYESIDQAEVVVSIDSTLGYESIARGNKTAMFPIRTQLLDVPGLTYGWPEPYPDEGPFWTNRPDPAAFERILDHLFALNAEQWQAERDRCGYSSVMEYDQDNGILQSILSMELGHEPPSTNLASDSVDENLHRYAAKSRA